MSLKGTKLKKYRVCPRDRQTILLRNIKGVPFPKVKGKSSRASAIARRHTFPFLDEGEIYLKKIKTKRRKVNDYINKSIMSGSIRNS